MVLVAAGELELVFAESLDHLKFFEEELLVPF
jgi:hypothetical protein